MFKVVFIDHSSQICKSDKKVSIRTVIVWCAIIGGNRNGSTESYAIKKISRPKKKEREKKKIPLQNYWQTLTQMAIAIWVKTFDFFLKRQQKRVFCVTSRLTVENTTTNLRRRQWSQFEFQESLTYPLYSHCLCIATEKRTPVRRSFL